LNGLVARHEPLRTGFTTVEGRPVQIVLPSLRIDFPLVDLTALPAARREAVSQALAEDVARRPYDLERGPLLRARLLRQEPGRHLAVITMHHIVSDGWSLGVMLRDLTALYAAEVEGRPDGLPELPVQYADFAAWQREWLTGDVLDAQLGWWRGRLAGAPPVLELPSDRPRPAVQSFHGGTLLTELPVDLSERLAILGRREGATLYMALLAAFATLLGRLAGEEDVVV